MTEIAGSAKQVGQGLTQKTFSYEPLNALVDIVTNTAGTFSARPVYFTPDEALLTISLVGQVVSAVVQKTTGGGGSASPSATPSATPMPVSLPVSSATST
jgi:hypothetical protein